MVGGVMVAREAASAGARTGASVAGHADQQTAAGAMQQLAAGGEEQEEEAFAQEFEIDQLVTYALLEDNMEEDGRITVEWMTAFATTQLARYTYRKKQLTPAELAHLAEMFWINEESD